MNKYKLYTVAGIFTGLFFIVSGIAKAFDSDYFGNIMVSYGQEIFYWTAPFVIFTELLLGLALILEIFPKYTASAGAIIVALYTAIYTYGLLFVGVKECGCFGYIPILQTSPRLLYIRNFLLMIVLLYIAVNSKKESSAITAPVFFICLCMMYTGAFIGGNTFKVSTHRLYSAGKFSTTPLSQHILKKFVTTSPDSTYLVIAFSYTCPHCINSVGNLEQFEKMGIVDKVIGLAIENPKEEIKFTDTFKPSFKIINYTAEDMRNLTTDFPTSYMIKRDSIIGIISGEVPSAYFFK